MRARVIRDYRTRYHEPVTLARGETVTLGERDVDWPAYIWGTDPRGRSGWIPDAVLEATQGIARATQDYSARELDADAGEIVTPLREAGGWWWSRNARGEEGWLPARDLEFDKDQTR